MSRFAASVGSFRCSGADDGVQFVDEQNDVPRGRLHFFEHRLEPLFELAAELRAGDERAHVERDHLLVLQALRHVPLHDPLRQPFGDGRFADARLADQHRIVLRAPREHLDDAADFLIAADHRIELPLLSPFDEIDAVLLQGLELGFRVLIGHAREPRTDLQSLEDLFLAHALSFSSSWPWNRSWPGPSNRCSVETNSSFIVSACAGAASSTDIRLPRALRRRSRRSPSASA